MLLRENKRKLASNSLSFSQIASGILDWVEIVD